MLVFEWLTLRFLRHFLKIENYTNEEWLKKRKEKLILNCGIREKKNIEKLFFILCTLIYFF